MAQIEYVELDSQILKSNPLGDPARRRFPVYLPPDYSKSRTYPVLYMLTGFSGQGEYYLYKRTFQQSMDEIFDEIIREKKSAPFLCVMPNCLSYYGGSQYVNSSAVGNYQDYLIHEILPFIDKNFATNGRRAVAGGSSGGIGAFTLGAKYPQHFQSLANHSGDSAFDYCYTMDVPKVVSYLEKFDFDLEKFLARLNDPMLPKDTGFMATVNVIAMCACYLPNPSSKVGFDVYFDLHDGEINEDLHQKLLAHDPVVFAAQYAENLKQLKHIHIDCGSQDQFHLYLGSRQLHKKLKGLGIQHSYEEYKSDHFLLRREQKKKHIPALINALG